MSYQFSEQLKDIVKRLLPTGLAKKIAKWRHGYIDKKQWSVLSQDWDQIDQIECRSSKKMPKKLIILPCDYNTITGSIGDEAMIGVMLENFKENYPDLIIGIAASTERGVKVIESLGQQPLLEMGKAHTVPSLIRAVSTFDPDLCVIIGADIMDGYYSAPAILHRLIIAQICARLGAKVCVTGFSFNAKPVEKLLPFYRRLAPSIVMNLRDPVSLDRFNKFTKTNGKLVTDCAFILKPDFQNEAVQAAKKWVQLKKHENAKVIGININPHLFTKMPVNEIIGHMPKIADVLHKIGQEKNIKWLLLPHDFRPLGEGDMTCLGPIVKRLNYLGSDYFLSTAKKASQIKAIASMSDGVISGRMHLLIGALGMGVPVGGFEYQGKFEGLFQHFELPKSLLLPPEEMLDTEILTKFINDVIDAFESSRVQISKNLSHVMKMSRENIQPLL